MNVSFGKFLTFEQNQVARHVTHADANPSGVKNIASDTCTENKLTILGTTVGTFYTKSCANKPQAV